MVLGACGFGDLAATKETRSDVIGKPENESEGAETQDTGSVERKRGKWYLDRRTRRSAQVLGF